MRLRSLPPLADQAVRRLLRRPPADPLAELRLRLAKRYLRGTGVEIGALHLPLTIPAAAEVRYVDRMGIEGLREHYPELRELPLVDVDIVDDGETLITIGADSLDFVIANHFIEHSQDPIGTIKQHVRTLKEGGILYLAVPDKRFTFDYDRPVTPIEHLRRDNEEGPDWSQKQHFDEWVRVVEKITEPAEVAERVSYLMGMDYSIHYHVWTSSDFVELLIHCRQTLGLPIELEAMQRNEHEFICIVRKQTHAPPRPRHFGRVRALEGVT